MTMLHCLVAPEHGAGTNFASTANGLATLPPAERERLAELEVVHLPRPFFTEELQADPTMTNAQPLVRLQPQTRRTPLRPRPRHTLHQSQPSPQPAAALRASRMPGPALYLGAEDLYLAYRSGSRGWRKAQAWWATCRGRRTEGSSCCDGC